ADFALPDGDGFLERINAVATRLECLRPMRRADRDNDTRLAEFDAPEAVMDYDLAAPALFSLLRDSAHHLFGHRHVGVVLQIGDFATARLAAHLPDERADSPVRIR